MSQQEQDAGWTGVYVNPMAQRRTDFADACGTLFAQLRLADSADGAVDLLARQSAALPAAQSSHAAGGLLVIDLERFEASIDLPALGALLAGRGGAPVLLLCPFASAGWLPLLSAFGPFAYAITPLTQAALRERVQGCLQAAGACAPALGAPALRALLALRGRVQAALEAQDVQPAQPPQAAQLGVQGGEHGLAERLCHALAGWPGVLHAAVFHLKEEGDLQLEAEQGQGAARDLHLGALLQRSSGLLQAPLRHAFPGLLAAAGGGLVLLESAEQAGEPALAEALRAHGVALALGIPIPADGPGAPRGALSLLLDAGRELAPEEFAALQDAARLAALGLRLIETNRESEQLLARLTYVSTTDALTGVANRRRGEELLEREVKRARRYRAPLALLSFDIDRFKAINDTYGHPVGDVALRTVADCVGVLLRSSDVLVRSGGEEFHVIAPHTSAIDGLRMAEKIRHAVEQATVPGCDHVTVSLGVAQLGEQESADSLARRADAAMARAKRAGRNCVELAMQ